MTDIPLGSTYNRSFLMVSSADHISPLTNATVTVLLSKAGGAFAPPSGTVTEIGDGWYSLALSRGDTNTSGDLAYHSTAPGGDPTDFVDQVFQVPGVPAPCPAPAACDPCQPIVFNYQAWIAAFPEFSPLTPQQGQSYFNRACRQFANSPFNPANGPCNEPMRGLFYLLTSHIAWLFCPKDANGNPSATGTINRLVGRISNASEGSVSVALAYESSGSPDEAYYSQTPYGLEFWNDTAPYRTARYLARPTRVINGFFPGWGGRGFGRRW